MTFRITRVDRTAFPDATSLSESFAAFGIPAATLEASFESFVCSAPLEAGRGYQQSIARELEHHLSEELGAPEHRVVRRARYSPHLNEQSDLAIRRDGTDSFVFIEIEFRPNVEKDLIKFQIGKNSGRLAGAVLVLMTDRNSVNPRYTSMPEYRKFVRVIGELRPQYPLLLVGLSGQHE